MYANIMFVFTLYKVLLYLIWFFFLARSNSASFQFFRRVGIDQPDLVGSYFRRRGEETIDATESLSIFGVFYDYYLFKRQECRRPPSFA